MTPLTEREIQIAKLVWEELSNKKIAEKLEIAESTVENHLSNIFTKYGIHSRVGLIKKLLEKGEISA